jgi:hypothetical protein
VGGGAGMATWARWLAFYLVIAAAGLCQCSDERILTPSGEAHRGRTGRSLHPIRTIRSLLGIGGCKKVLWFTAIGGSGDHYKKYIRVAMMSKKQHAPSLVPHLIYSGTKDEHFLNWYTDNGGTVHHHNLSFYDKLEASVKAGKHDAGWLTQHGAYLRMDLPLILKGMQLTDPGIEKEYLLYTDADVMFWNDVNSCSFAKPPILSIGPEWTKGLKVNSGSTPCSYGLVWVCAQPWHLLSDSLTQSSASHKDRMCCMHCLHCLPAALPACHDWSHAS